VRNKPDADLQLEYLKLKSASFDHVTGLPCVNTFYRPLVKILNRKQRIGCFLITIANGGEIEKELSFNVYDKLLSKICSELNNVLDSCGLKDQIIAASDPGCETFFVFVVENPPNLLIHSDFLEDMKGKLTESLSSKVSEFIKTEHLQMSEPIIMVVAKIIEGSTIVRTERQLSRELNALKMEIAKVSETQEYNKRILIKKMIDRKSTDIVFQPIVNAKEKTVFGYEALARGTDQIEFHNPDVFLNLAQKYNMLREIESVCVLNAIETLYKALSSNSKIARKKIFINLSPPSFPILLDDEFTQSLKQYEISPEQIVIELTERFSSQLPQENEVYFDIIKRISKHGGFEIAVDDVGTGYSTLERIAALNPQYIKYDRSLFKNVYRDSLKQELLKTIFDFSNKINSRLIVEGVDNQDDYNFALKLGVEYMQGFLFGRPLKF